MYAKVSCKLKSDWRIQNRPVGLVSLYVQSLHAVELIASDWSLKAVSIESELLRSVEPQEMWQPHWFSRRGLFSQDPWVSTIWAVLLSFPTQNEKPLIPDDLRVDSFFLMHWNFSRLAILVAFSILSRHRSSKRKRKRLINVSATRKNMCRLSTTTRVRGIVSKIGSNVTLYFLHLDCASYHFIFFNASSTKCTISDRPNLCWVVPFKCGAFTPDTSMSACSRIDSDYHG